MNKKLRQRSSDDGAPNRREQDDITSSRVRAEAQPVHALGIQVTPATAEDILAIVSANANRSEGFVIAGHNLHSAYLFQHDREFRRFYERADVTLIDGWPILALLNRTRRRAKATALTSSFRIGSTDWIPAAVALPAIQRFCILGARKEANEALVAKLSASEPQMEFLGLHSDPWEHENLHTVAAEILAFKPQLTIIGMGMPLQESVALELLDSGVHGVIATVGGAIDQLSGQQSLAPRWTGRLRVEWLWRLASDPRRLGHRYLVEPIQLALTILRQKNR